MGQSERVPWTVSVSDSEIGVGQDFILSGQVKNLSYLYEAVSFPNWSLGTSGNRSAGRDCNSALYEVCCR
jgi:hypothetical protein